MNNNIFVGGYIEFDGIVMKKEEIIIVVTEIRWVVQFSNMLANRLHGETRARRTVYGEARLKRKSELGNNQGVFYVSCTNRA